MNTFYEHHQNSIRFTYRCFDRMLLNGLIQPFQQEGWAGIENGELLALAADSFAVFLTVDKQIQHQLQAPPTLTVVTMRARANRIDVLRPLVPDVLNALEHLQPGRFIQVGASFNSHQMEPPRD